jgi:HlyD family secretion protein
MRGSWLRAAVLLCFVILLAIAGGWWVVRGLSSNTPALKAEQETSPSEAAGAETVKTDAPLPLPDQNTLSSTGVIEPFETLPVSPRITAPISRMLVREGSLVRKGQILCLLDDTELRTQINHSRLSCLQADAATQKARQGHRTQAEEKRLKLAEAQQKLAFCRAESEVQLAQAEAVVQRAEKDLQDGRTLYQAKAISAEQVGEKQEAWEEAQRQLAQKRTSRSGAERNCELQATLAERAANEETVTEQEIAVREQQSANSKAELRTAQNDLASVRISAPIAGVVHIIPRLSSSSSGSASGEILGPGVKVFEGEPFLEIASTAKACIRLEVDETDVTRLRVGTPATITGNAFPDRELPGEIIAIQTTGRKAGEGVSLFPVTLLITSPLQEVRMGMIAEIQFHLKPDISASREER